jgi:hypothetical protein
LDDLGPVTDRAGDLLAKVPDHDRDGGGVEGPAQLDHLADHRPAGDRMEELGEAGSHPGALAGGQHDDRDATALSRGF